ncbi:MAG: cation diffusion facilitator family transporter [Dehalococcoidia bacterium]|nr:cation diffusion facilitator family transporter [Dehalococcoidia bacterium]
MFRTKTGAAGLSVLSNTLLILLKLVAGILTGSVSIIAEAIHSGIDLLAALIAFVSLRIAGRPADREHPFGHGKVENVSGTIEAVLIFVAAIFIIYQAINRIIAGAIVEYLSIGITVMAISVVVNIIVSRHLLRIARDSDSIALEADARHLTADVYTSLGVLAGLVVVQVTGLNILDPIIAICVSIFILRAAYNLTRRAFPPLIDTRLPEDEEVLIESIMSEHMGELVGFHELRTRKAGSERYIELHMMMARDASVERAHSLCDHLEEDIKSRLPNIHVTIHIEPCDMDCDTCPDNCPQDQNMPGP